MGGGRGGFGPAGPHLPPPPPPSPAPSLPTAPALSGKRGEEGGERGCAAPTAVPGAREYFLLIKFSSPIPYLHTRPFPAASEPPQPPPSHKHGPGRCRREDLPEGSEGAPAPHSSLPAAQLTVRPKAATAPPPIPRPHQNRWIPTPLTLPRPQPYQHCRDPDPIGNTETPMCPASHSWFCSSDRTGRGSERVHPTPRGNSGRWL